MSFTIDGVEIQLADSPSRKRIVREYFKLKHIHNTFGGNISGIIARNLDYSVDQNGSNSFVIRVLRECLKNAKE
jgi:hypothetical protein